MTAPARTTGADGYDDLGPFADPAVVRRLVAGSALYRAKATGRGRWVRHDDGAEAG